MESGIHRGPLADLISLCLSPCVTPQILTHNHKHVCTNTQTHAHLAPSRKTNSCKTVESRMPLVYQLLAPATLLGGNARRRAAFERQECAILVFCLCQRERKLTSERERSVVEVH